jgi:hypothetical protein
MNDEYTMPPAPVVATYTIIAPDELAALRAQLRTAEATIERLTAWLGHITNAQIGGVSCEMCFGALRYSAQRAINGDPAPASPAGTGKPA